jgi:V8-like Glu-specific endopeptidase
MCSRYTAPGDSGSLVLSSSGLVLGLHFAGSNAASVFNRISNVLSAFDADIVTG